MSASTLVQRSPRVAVSAYFLSAGVGIGAWAACLPALSVSASLDKRELGIILLCFGLGAIVAMMNMGRVVARYGTGVACLICALVFGAALILVPHVTGTIWLLALLILIGGGAFGALDVAMNTDASVLERRSGQHIMSSFHAVFSVGSLAGAGAAAQLLRLGGDITTCLTAAGAAVIALSLFAWFWSLPLDGSGDEAQDSPGGNAKLDAVQKRRLWLIGALGFLGMMSEGAMLDWSALYLVGTIGTTESVGALGFATFAAAMAIGRGLGDMATRALGPAILLSVGSGVVAMALAAALIVETPLAVFVALGVCGLGIANIVPAVFSAAGRIGGEAAGLAMSRVSTLGYAGLLVGPPLIGFVAEATSLTIGLWMIVAAACIVAIGGGLVATPRK